MTGCAVVAAIVMAAAPSAAGAATLQTRSTDGVRLALYPHGNAKAKRVVIVIHGGPGNSHELMGPLPGSLASRAVRSVAYDERGVSGSTAPRNGRYTTAAYVEDLDAVRRALGAARVTLVGQSFGGYVAQAYAAAHPGRVAALALVDALPADIPAQQDGYGKLNARTIELQRAGLIPDPLPPDKGDSCSPSDLATLPVYLANPRMKTPAWYSAGVCRVSVRNATLSEITEPAVAAIQRGLRKLTAPALVIYGTRDSFGRRFDTASAKLLPRAHPRVVAVAGAGHTPWLEKPAQTYTELRRLIDRARTPR